VCVATEVVVACMMIYLAMICKRKMKTDLCNWMPIVK